MSDSVLRSGTGTSVGTNIPQRVPAQGWSEVRLQGPSRISVGRVLQPLVHTVLLNVAAVGSSGTFL